MMRVNNYKEKCIAGSCKWCQTFEENFGWIPTSKADCVYDILHAVFDEREINSLMENR